MQMLRRIVITVIAAFAMIPTHGSAYVLQGPHILELMMTNNGRARQLKVSQRLVLHDLEITGEETVVPEILRYRFPDRFRSDIEADNIRRIHVVTPRDRLSIVDGNLSTESGTWFDSYKDVILYSTRQLLIERLIQHGIDVHVSSVGRFEERIVLIIGAQYPDESLPQLWLDKETFRPVRLMVVRDAVEQTGPILDIRYRKWRQLGKIWYPMHVEFFQKEALLREIHAEETAVDSGFAEDYFDTAHLRAMYRSKSPDGNGSREPDDLDEIRKAIEEFRNIYD